MLSFQTLPPIPSDPSKSKDSVTLTKATSSPVGVCLRSGVELELGLRGAAYTGHAHPSKRFIALLEHPSQCAASLPQESLSLHASLWHFISHAILSPFLTCLCPYCWFGFLLPPFLFPVAPPPTLSNPFFSLFIWGGGQGLMNPRITLNFPCISG